MIVRMVKMTFDENKVDEFLTIFEATNSKIRAFEGCNRLELLRDIDKPNIFFTYSFWDSTAHLNLYRNSPLFDDVWAKTKALFIAKPEAWSTEQKVILE